MKSRFSAGIFFGGLLFLFPVTTHAAERSLKTETVQSLLGIPTDMAIVKGGYVPRGERFLHYVLIEDVHESAEAQGKIAAILLYGHHHWGSRQAFVEGAFGPIGPPPFPIFTPERGERGITELLRDGLFSAGELAAALSSGRGEVPFAIVGMDDPFLYRQQLEIFEDLAAHRDQALARLNQPSGALSPSQRELIQRLLEVRLSPSSYKRYLRTARPIMESPILSRAIALAEMYYRITDERSHYFASMTRDRVGKGPCLLVMGGFHTPQVAKILRARGESFMILTPRLREGGHRNSYEVRLARSLQTLQRVPTDSPLSSPAGILSLSLAHQTR